MEEIIDAVTGIGTDNCTPICTCNRLSLNERQALDQNQKKITGKAAHITLPMSRSKAPGLHILMASSRDSRVVRISLAESSSISPTG